MKHPDSPAITATMDGVTCKTCQRSFQAAQKRATRPFQIEEELIYVGDKKSEVPDSQKTRWKVICFRSTSGETDVRASDGMLTTITRENVSCWRRWSPSCS
jgi:hypothetical protein